MNFISQITPFTWLFLITLILTIFGYIYHKRIIFFFAKRNKAWAIKAVYRLNDELEERKLKDKQKRLDKYIERADELSKANNGRRMYVLPVNEDFAIVDSKYGKQWLKDNGYNSQIILAEKCVYYTAATNLCMKNIEPKQSWLDSFLDWFERIMFRVGVKRF